MLRIITTIAAAMRCIGFRLKLTSEFQKSKLIMNEISIILLLKIKS
jgi:hypothetical protein